MLIFRDLITEDELFTDANKIDLVDDCIYEVVCNSVSRKQGDFVLAGSNPSAEGEDADDGPSDEVVETGLDLVLNQKLNETKFDKAAYKTYLKGYTKSLQEKWKSMEMSEEEIKDAQNKFKLAVSKVLPKLDEFAFYIGESYNPDGMVALLEYRDKPDGSGHEARMLFFKQGLESEKV